jgi:hypothetical protein
MAKTGVIKYIQIAYLIWRQIKQVQELRNFDLPPYEIPSENTRVLIASVGTRAD